MSPIRSDVPSDTLLISKEDEVHAVVMAEPSIAKELSETLTFMPDGYQYTPKYKNGWWDGKIRLYSESTGRIYHGLIEDVVRFAMERGYSFKFKKEDFEIPRRLSDQEIWDFIRSLNIPEKYQVRDYQFDYIRYCINHRRAIIESPTASGKSLVIYILTRFFGKRVLICVPTIQLVEQMRSDFIDYGCAPDSIHRVYSGADKSVDAPIVISTWQSLTNKSFDKEFGKAWFKKFESVIVDEVHLFAGNVTRKVLENCVNAKNRIGTTGSLKDCPIHELTLRGLTGKVKKFVTTRQLIDQGWLSNIKVRVVVFDHGEEFCRKHGGGSWQEEVTAICEHEKRNRFISNMATGLNGNTLVLFNYVKKHGKVLYDMISEKGTRKVFFVHGGVEVEDREEVRRIASENDGVVIVASYGTFSTGINIPNLHNLIFASPFKTNIRLLQSIGRMLRTHESKELAVIYDLADDMRVGSRDNLSLGWLSDRLRVYITEDFDYNMVTISI